MCGSAVAHLKLSVFDFYELSPVEYKYAIEANNDIQIDKYHTDWETARYIVFHNWNASGNLKYGLKKPEEVGLFGWEQAEKLEKKQTVGEIKQEVLRIAEIFGAKKKEE